MNPFLRICSVLLFATVCGRAAAADTTVTVTYGETYVYNTADIVVHAARSGISVYVPGVLTARVAPPADTEALTRGKYLDTVTPTSDYPFRATMDLGFMGTSCGPFNGSFDLRQVTYDAAGQMTSFEVAMHLSCWPSPMEVVIKHKVLPMWFSYISSAPDTLGGGQSRTFRTHSSQLALDGTATGLTYAVSGDREDWLVEIAPPAGQALTAGTTYATTETGASGGALLRVAGSSGSCAGGTGSLKINGLKQTPAGAVNALSAAFTLVCGSGKTFRGSIRHSL